MTASGFITDTAVTSVNDETGDVELDAADVAADAAGTAAAAVTTHAGAADPHADRAFATAAVSTHAGGSGVHTIAGTTGLQAALDAKVASSEYTAFAAATLGTGVTARASSGTPGSRSEPGDVVRLRGAVDISGNPAAGTVLLTLDSRDWPTGGGIVHPGVRTGPTGNIATVLHIDTSGQVTLAAAPGNGAYLGLDGITFVRTVA